MEPQRTRRFSLTLPTRGGASRIRLFNGTTRRTSDWDGLRKDKQLWIDDADCLVHFHAHRASQRGPSLRIPFAAVEKLGSDYLQTACLRKRNVLSPIPSEDGNEDSSSGSEVQRSSYELYIPAPADLTREQAFFYHLTTRNVIAYAVQRPLVGEKLSTALQMLWQRLKKWCPSPAPLADFTRYCQSQRYTDFAENSEHALACLKFADEARLKELWLDSFVHCVGMHDRLDLSPEFAGLSKTTEALITRASLEMDLHIGRVVRAVGNFLEVELGRENIGLSKAARDHLDRFRTCLQMYYVNKLGYFPPSYNTPWDKQLWSGIYKDFQGLYDYLVDHESTGDLTSNRGLNGGVCVTQNVQAFDQRHGYIPLPHPLPRFPELPAGVRRDTSSQRGLRALKLGRSRSQVDNSVTTPKQALAHATNFLDVEDHPLVQEYQRFERQRLEEKLDLSEARKIRWILIYGVLQMLTSIMKPPKGVQNTAETSYPVCVLTKGCPRWVMEEDGVEEADTAEAMDPAITSPAEALEELEKTISQISIRPDCEAESAEDFFAQNTPTKKESDPSLMPPLLRITTPSRTATLRSSMQSSVQAIHQSVKGNLSRRDALRRSSMPFEPKKRPSYCQIWVEGYGNGLSNDGGNLDFSVVQPPFTDDPAGARVKNPFDEFDFDLGTRNDEPTLEHDQLHKEANGDHGLTRSPSDSNASSFSDHDDGSSRSPSSEAYDSPISDLSSWDGRNYKRDSDLSTATDESQPPTPPSYEKEHSGLKKTGSLVSVNAGCYLPTGMLELPLSKFAQHRTLSSDTVKSGTSSNYPEEDLQADDIEEEEYRGRRRSRALDRLSRFGKVRVDSFVS